MWIVKEDILDLNEVRPIISYQTQKRSEESEGKGECIRLEEGV